MSVPKIARGNLVQPRSRVEVLVRFDQLPENRIGLPEELPRGRIGDVGARELLKGGRLIECDDLVAGADVDTPEDLRRIRSSE